MRKLLLACAIALTSLSTSLAYAYDNFNNCCPQQCDPCCGRSGFDGFYVGGNLGVFSHVAHRNDYDAFHSDNAGFSSIDTDFTAGLQLGYDWQCGSRVVGLVVDWNWANTDNKQPDNPNGPSDDFTRAKAEWFTTIRARAGLNVCDALVYITAGAAVTRFKDTWFDEPDRFNHHNSRWGWVGGAGAEFIIGCNWSVGAEVLFLTFKEHKKTFTTVGGTPFLFGHSDQAWVARFLVNYRFGDLGGCCGWW